MTASFPSAKACQDSSGSVQTRQHIRNSHSDLARWPFDRAGNAHQPALCLDSEVVAGGFAERTSPAETANRANDQARVLTQELLGGQAQFFGGIRAEVLDQHIGSGKKAMKDRFPGLVRDI